MKALNVSGGVEIMIRIVSHEAGCVELLPVNIPLLPWQSAMQAVGLGRQNFNRKLVHAT